MADTLRTALKGGGKIVIVIDVWANGDFHLQVTEDWGRLTSVQKTDIPAAKLAAADHPDGLIAAAISKLVAEAHIRYEARQTPAEG